MMRTVLRGLCVAVLALVAGTALNYLIDWSGQDVPDVAATGPVVEEPKPWELDGAAEQPRPSTATQPPDRTLTGRTPAAVPAPAAPVAQAVRPPLQFPTITPAPEVDYRAGRIMEPWPRDDLESQRRRAYARCVAGLEDDARQLAYCDRWYGPESGYTPDR
jgi:hypothetical protein